MKKFLYSVCAIILLTIIVISCQKSESVSAEPGQLTADEKAMVKSAGFNSGWAEKTAEGNFLVEGDMLFTKAQLQELAAKTPDHNFIIANEEHYRTTNLVNAGTGRVITVRLGSGFPSHYSTGLDQAIARYNSYGLLLTFQRVTTGGDIVITGANLGRTIGGGCILGQAAGFPTGGNPSSGFTLSTSKCATQYLNTAAKADEVIAHEIGHCIGFRHTDYMNRASCGSNSNEGDAGVGAIHIPGTPTTVTGNFNSWMMACTNGSPLFGPEDGVALTTVY